MGVSCVSGGPVFCRVSLDRGGYVPGETIGISATVSNRSKVYIVINVANECNFDIFNNFEIMF